MLNTALSTGIVKPQSKPMRLTLPTNNMMIGESITIINNSDTPIDLRSQEITHNIKWKDSRTVVVTNKDKE